MEKSCTVIELVNLSHGYPGAKARVLKKLNENFSTGIPHLIQGRNGSGKTTLLKILSGLIHPFEGDALVCGVSVARSSAKIRSKVGWVPASDGGFFPKLNGRENLQLFGSLRGMRRSEVRQRIDSWLEILPLRDALETPFSQCSAGMRQALQITRAMLPDPWILILDEPMRALDEVAQTELGNRLIELSKERLVLMTAHAHSGLTIFQKSRKFSLQEGKLLENHG